MFIFPSIILVFFLSRSCFNNLVGLTIFHISFFWNCCPFKAIMSIKALIGAYNSWHQSTTFKSQCISSSIDDYGFCKNYTCVNASFNHLFIKKSFVFFKGFASTNVVCLFQDNVFNTPSLAFSHIMWNFYI